MSFLTLYIKEAHPTDEWQVDSNEGDDVCYLQPRSIEQRRAIANDFIERYAYGLAMVLDTMDNEAEEAYAAWPERLYIVGPDGTIVHKSGMGPQGFKPDEVHAWLEAHAAR